MAIGGQVARTDELNESGLIGEWVSGQVQLGGGTGVQGLMVQVEQDVPTSFRSLGWLYLLRTTVPGLPAGTVAQAECLPGRPVMLFASQELTVQRGSRVLFIPRPGVGSFSVTASGTIS